MATTYPISKNSYATMREIELFINSFKLPNIRIVISPLTDDFTIFNTDNNKSERITRYALEDAADPKAIILEAISHLMAVPINQLGDIIKDAMNAVNRKAVSTIVPTQPVSGAVYTTNSTGPIWVSSGGGGSGAIGHTMKTWVDDPHTGHVGYVPLGHEEIEIRDKTFGPYEQALITGAKMKLKQKYWMYIPSELMYSKHIVIAGGCWASLFHGDTPHDIDVFILNDQNTKDLVHKHVEQIKFKNPSSEIIKEGSNNYMDNDSIEYTAFDMITKVQLITTKYNTRKELLDHFDMLHCCVSYTPWDDRLYITRDVYDTIIKKAIRPQSGIWELVKPWRIDKMEKRGWVKV